MEKEKKPFFTTMEFNSAQYAMDTKAKCEAKLARIKIGMWIAVGVEIGWLLTYVFRKPFNNMPAEIAGILLLILAIGALAAYIIGGGLGMAFKVTFKIAFAIGWFGWVCLPFPVDIITGLFLSILAIIMIPVLFVFIPLVLVFCNYYQVKKDYNAAEEYLKYCTPVENAQ